MEMTLQRAFPILAGMIANKADINLKFGRDPNLAATNGKTITVPVIQSDSGMAEPMLGFLAHEASHVRHTVFSTMTDAGSPMKRQMLNALEDTRIEWLMAQLYKGVVPWIRSMNEHLQFGAYNVVDDDSANLLNYVHLLSAWRELPECYPMVARAVQALENRVEEVYGRGFLIRLKALIGTLLEQKDTYGVLDLVEKIMALVEEQANDDDQDSDDADQNNDSQQSDSGADDANAAGGSGDDSGHDAGNQKQSGGTGDDGGDETGQQTGQSSSCDQSEDNSGQSQSGSADSDAGQGSSATQESANGDDKANGPQRAQEAAQEFLDSQNDYYQDKGERFLDQCSDDIDEATDSLNTELGSSLGDALEETTVQSTKAWQPDVETVAHGSSVRQTMQRLLEAEQRSKRSVKRSGKRLKSNRLHRLSSGDTKVFRSNNRKKGLDTAIYVLVDMSSSMTNNSRYVVARQAAGALALSAKALKGVDVGIGSFGSDFHAVKEFSQSLEHSDIDAVHPSGYTPLGEAMMIAARKLQQEKADRHVLMVLSDGRPNDPSSVVFARDMLQQCGVEIIGLGIQSPAIKSLISRSVVISDLGDLQPVMLAEMSQIIRAA